MAEICFGTAGICDSFRENGCKSSLDIPQFTALAGLNAFEYQCGHGVHLGLDKAAAMREQARKLGVMFSVHAPYYISMTSQDDEKRMHSVDYLLQSCALVKALGGRRVVFHPGACSGTSREEALALASDTLAKAMKALDDNGFGDCILCPETMGKCAQLGSLDEVLALCKIDDRLLPCLDFGHLNARTLGSIRTKADYRDILHKVSSQLGTERGKRFHVHFSHIEYTARGEKRHLTFADTQWGPSHEPLMELLAEEDRTPTIICESAGTQAEDAVTMMRYYRSVHSV